LVKARQGGVSDFEPWVYTTNKSPTVTTPQTSASYLAGQPPAVLAPSAEIADDNPNFDGGVILVELADNKRNDDQLGFLETGRARVNGDSLEIDSSGARTAVAKIGLYSNYMGRNGQPLMLTMNAACTPAVAQEILRALCYSSSNSAPITKPRKIRITLDDGAGGEAAPVEITVKYEASPKPIEDKPKPSTDTPKNTQDARKPVSDALKAEAISVRCREDSLCDVVLEGKGGSQFTVSRQPANGVLSGKPPRLTYTPRADFAGVDEFEYFVSDGKSESAPALAMITVVGVNDTPVFTALGGLKGATAGKPFTITFAALSAVASMSDVDGEPLSFRVVSIESGDLMLDGVAAQSGKSMFSSGSSLTWTPGGTSKGDIAAFRVAATDGQLDSEATFKVVIQVNAAPAAPPPTPTPTPPKSGCSTQESNALPILAAIGATALAFVVCRRRRTRVI
jgi:hypothetical protein